MVQNIPSAPYTIETDTETKVNPFPTRGFVNSTSSSTTCFSVMEELFDGIV